MQFRPKRSSSRQFNQSMYLCNMLPLILLITLMLCRSPWEVAATAEATVAAAAATTEEANDDSKSEGKISARDLTNIFMSQKGLEIEDINTNANTIDDGTKYPLNPLDLDVDVDVGRSGLSGVSLPNYFVDETTTTTEQVETPNISSSSSSVQRVATNVARGKFAEQTQTGNQNGLAYLALDGNNDGIMNNGSVSGTGQTTDPWWKVNLGEYHTIQTIKVHRRTESCCRNFINGFIVEIFYHDTVVWTYTHPNSTPTRITTLAVSPDVLGDVVKIRLVGENRNLCLAEVEVIAPPPPYRQHPLINVALGKNAIQIQTDNNGVASKAVDGNTSGDLHYYHSVSTTGSIDDPWWGVDLVEYYAIHEIKIYRRTDCCVGNNQAFIVEILDRSEGKEDEDVVVWTYTHYDNVDPAIEIVLSVSPVAFGTFVQIRLEGQDRNLQLAEVEVYAKPYPMTIINHAVGQSASQSHTSNVNGAEASRAIDGNENGNFGDDSVSSTGLAMNPWWKVDLETPLTIHAIVIYRRTDDFVNSLRGFIVEIHNGENVVWTYTHTFNGGTMDEFYWLPVSPPLFGDAVKIRLEDAETRKIELAEVKIYSPIPLFFIEKPSTRKVISAAECHFDDNGIENTLSERLLTVADIDQSSTKQMWYYADERIYSVACPGEVFNVGGCEDNSVENRFEISEYLQAQRGQMNIIEENEGALSYLKNEYCNKNVDLSDDLTSVDVQSEL